MAEDSDDGQQNYSSTKKPWVKAEDDVLMALVSQFGSHDWYNIAFEMQARGVQKTGKQCRERWLNQLSPNVRKDPWTPEEDQLIVENHKRLGNKWVQISKLLQGRPPNAVKNRWNGTLHRKVQQGDGSGVVAAIGADGQPIAMALAASSEDQVSANLLSRSNSLRKSGGRKRRSGDNDVSDEDSDIEFNPNPRNAAGGKAKRRKTGANPTPSSSIIKSEPPLQGLNSVNPLMGLYQNAQGLPQFMTSGNTGSGSTSGLQFQQTYFVDPSTGLYYPLQLPQGSNPYSAQFYAATYPGYPTGYNPSSIGGSSAATTNSAGTNATPATVDELSAMYITLASQQVQQQQQQQLQAQLQQQQQLQQLQNFMPLGPLNGSVPNLIGTGLGQTNPQAGVNGSPPAIVMSGLGQLGAVAGSSLDSAGTLAQLSKLIAAAPQQPGLADVAGAAAVASLGQEPAGGPTPADLAVLGNMALKAEGSAATIQS